MTIKHFERATCSLFRIELAEATKALAAKHGVSVEIGKMRFDQRTLDIAVKFNTINADGKAETSDMIAFKSLATHYGLAPDDLGRIVMDKGQRFEITGLNTRAPKSPVHMKRLSDGKSFKAPVSWVKSRFPAAPAAPYRELRVGN